jgi:CubicO group peptidase (beta-lactamase class C family)
MRRHVFEPIGLHDTVELRAGVDDPEASTSYDFVTPYSRDGRRVRSPSLDFTCKWPSGGFVSTAEDMAHFAAAHGSGTGSFLRPETQRIQFQARTPPSSPAGMALGWLVARDWRLRRVVFNFGAGSGGRGFLVLYPDQNVSVAVLANLGHARMDMRRLVGITVPFLDAKRSPWPELAGLLVSGLWIWRIVNRTRRT